MKARELQAYLQALRGDWEYPPDTVDTFKAGDPETSVRGVAVGWMSYTWALERALERGCNVFITHEPTYYSHRENDESIFRFPQAAAKRRFIEDNDLVIIRCHDLWDQYLDAGIPDSWGRLLQLSEAVDQTEHLRLYEIAPRSAYELARDVARSTAPFGQPGVQLIGPTDKVVYRVGIGTGAITPYFSFVERFEVDAAICTDDGIHYWRDGGFATDAGIPIIVVNHMVAEEIGVISLANHLRAHLPSIPIHHIPQRCMYQLVTPS